MANNLDKIADGIDGLLAQIRREQDNLQDGFFEAEGGEKVTKPISSAKVPKQVKLLKGHFGPIYALHWAGTSREAHLCSVSQDSKLIVWHAITQMKVSAVSEANWAMTCAFEQTKGERVAYGGLDNFCRVFDIKEEIGPNEPRQVLRDLHQGYLSCCRFTDGGKSMLTSSGDGRCAYWDIESGASLKIFSGHKADCMFLSVCPTDDRIFVSASVDKTCKLWDTREDKHKSAFTFEGHESDVNTVEFFPDGLAFASGSDDASCKLFDRRSFQCVNTYRNDGIVSAVTSVAFSHSGRILFSGYENENSPIAWDVVAPGENMIARLSSKHTRKISSLGVSSKGHALASSSWDNTIRIWA